MSNLSWDPTTPDGHQARQERGLDRYDPCEIETPEPLRVFTRLGLLLMSSLAFGLVAELLVQMPPH